MTKYSHKIMDIIVDGVKVGELIRTRTAEQYAQEYWAFMQIRKYFNEMPTKKSFQTPIIGG